MVLINGQLNVCEPAVEAYIKDLRAKVEFWCKLHEEVVDVNTQYEETIKALKAENKRLEEAFPKATGVIAVTDCVECKKDAEPVKHGELWVSCSERLPEMLTETLDGRYSDCCLVFAEKTEWIGMAYYRTNNSETWWEFADAQNKPKIDWAEITHWMPLPNCPNCDAKMD